NVRQLLDRGIATVRRRFAGHPEVQATLLTAIGAIHRKMGDYDLAGALIEGALAEFRAPQDTNDPTLASIRHEQGLLQMERGRFAAAGVHFEEALRIRRKALGEHHPETLQSQVELAEINRLLANFGGARQLAGDALDTLAETGRRQHALFARSLTVLGWLDLQGRRVDLATSRLEEALRVQERYHGQDHAAAATTTVTLAMAHHAAGESERATTLLRRALTIYENRLGTEHLYVAIALMNLARIEIDAARFDEAKAALDRAGRILQASAGPDSVLFALWISDIARIQLHRDEVEAAEEKLQAAHAILVEALPPDHPLALETLNLLGDAARRRGGLQRADERFAETMDSQLGSHPETPL
ncbi:MAG: tetratricopeptide repeat protein, partial [Acidobacteriota bacterium]